jgi:lipopolysaccharide/colanic/teichoic acid biosynthesis glycosyltransferase
VAANFNRRALAGVMEQALLDAARRRRRARGGMSVDRGPSEHAQVEAQSMHLIVAGVPLRKRIFDLALTVPGLLLISPILVVISLLSFLLQGPPLLFRHERPGLRGEPFTLFKFRTMREARDAAGRPLADSERLTGWGRLLRSLSLDELPELFNVLRGEMSLVGPRPLLMQYLERYTPEQARRHEVLPGMTGWAQINGRNALTWERKFELDVWYVDHWSMGLDLRILAATLWKILLREGISQPGRATADEFMGTESPPDRPFARRKDS